MNDRNRDLFFNEDNEGNVLITLTDEDGKETEAELLILIEVEEMGKEYAAVLPLEREDDGSEEMEALIFSYSEDADGEPVFTDIADEEEYEMVSSIFDQVFSDSIEYDEEEDDDEDDDTGSDYLDDIGEIIPGVSIRKDW